MKTIKNKPDMKGFSMIRKTTIVSLVCAVVTWAAQDSVVSRDSLMHKNGLQPINETSLAKLEEAVNSSIAKAGISLGGQFNAQFLQSSVEGRAVAKNARTEEGVEFTGCDLDINARPASEVTARLMFRFYEDWRNMWNSFRDPITLRWVSVNGIMDNIFSYSVGDFKQKYSPLTLYSPDVDIAYEPQIFAEQRKVAMGELFLGDNERLLQGLNANFDAEISPVFKEFHFNVLGARLRNVEGPQTLLADPHLGVALMDKYLVSTNLDAQILNDLGFGATYLSDFDAIHSFGGSLDSATAIAQNTRVIAGRLNAGSGMFTDSKAFDIGLYAEFAYSLDDTAQYDTAATSSLQIRRSMVTVPGSALDVQLKGKVHLFSSFNVSLNAGYINTESDFRNDMAQSPTFFRTRIMNSENDVANGLLYSTFDGLYRQVYKFAVSENAGNADVPGWLQEPMNKIAYGNGVLTQKEMRSVPLDGNINSVMPFGPATPNRTGLVFDVSTDMLDKAVIASVSGKIVNEIDGQFAVVDTQTHAQGTLPQTSFTEIGGGLSVDIARFGSWWKYPCIISGGYVLSQLSNAGAQNYPMSPWTTTVGFANAGVYWTFIKHFSLLGGYQYLSNTGDGLYDNVKTTVTQLHYAAGIEYSISTGARLTGSYGVIEVHHQNDANVDLTNADFRQYQTDLYLTVNF